jgi:hypothetical protein
MKSKKYFISQEEHEQYMKTKYKFKEYVKNIRKFIIMEHIKRHLF